MNTSADKVLEQAVNGLGTPYVFGADGGPNDTSWDCSGFVLDCLRDSGAQPSNLPDMNAQGIYTWASKNAKRISVKDAFNMPIALVYRHSKSDGKIVHVGFATRGAVIHAKGKDYGTIQEPAKYSNWTHATTIPGVI
jgi:cell wall-associated NlpC family hydrolase